MVAYVTLFVFVAVLGIDLGAGLYETRVIAPLWRGAWVDRDERARTFMGVAPNAGQRFWMAVTPIVGVSALVTLVTGLHTAAPHRAWRLLASGLELLVVTGTFTYFVPKIKVLLSAEQGGLPPGVVAGRTRTWLLLNWGRVALTVVAWLAGLRALSLPV